MLRVESHNGLADAQAFDATKVLIRDKFDNPLVLIAVQGDLIHIKRAGDIDFDQYLELYGVNRTVVVKDHNVDKEIKIGP